MRLFVIAILSIGFFNANSQSSAFLKIEGQISQFIQQGQWDEVLMLAPDLIIESPQRGEGYFYTASAFYKIGNEEKGSTYLIKAENLADEELKRKIVKLREEIALEKNMASALQNTEQLSSQSDYKKSVEAWIQLWSKDKQKIEYALNGVELLLIHKQYVEALEILSFPEIAKEAEAQTIVDLINQTPEMKVRNAFINAMTKGRQYFNDQSYRLALQQFEEALNINPNDAEALEMKQKAEDEAAWQSATGRNTIDSYQEYINKPSALKNHKQSALQKIDEIAWSNAKNTHTQRSYQNYLDGNTIKAYKTDALRALDELEWQKAVQSNHIDAYERYVYAYPNGIHRTEADRIIKNSYIAFVDRYCASSDESEFLKYYEKYKARFPLDNDAISSLQDRIGQYYYATAQSQIESKRWGTAKEYYNKYISMTPYGPMVATAQQKIKYCDRKLRQSGGTCVMYAYDRQSPIGISIASLELASIGYYVTAKGSPAITKASDVLYTISDAGYSDRPGIVTRTGNVKSANICVSGGMTFKIAYPIWVQIGMGYGYFTVYEEADCYFSSGAYWEMDWLRNSDQTKEVIYPEAGLILKLGDKVTFKYGAYYLDGITHQFGLGFAVD